MNDGEIKFQVIIDDKAASATLSNLDKKSKDLSKSFKDVGSKMTLGLTVPILGLVGAGVKYNAEIEQLETSFAVMTGSADEAADVIKKLKKVGAKTPYELKGLAKTTQVLMQYGMTSEEAYNATLNFGDIAQGSAEKMEGIALAYGQMSSAGKVNMQDIKQMINQGFNPLQAIADKTGKTMQQVTKEYEAGTISVNDITQAMKYASSENGRYYKSMEKQSETTAGKLSTLKDNFNEATGTLTESLLPAINGVVDGLSDFASWFSQLDEDQRNFILSALGIVAALGPVLWIVGQISTAFGLLSGAFAFFAANPILVQIGLLIAALAVLYDSYKKVSGAVSELNKLTQANKNQADQNIGTTKDLTASAQTQKQKDVLINLYQGQLVRASNALKDQQAAITKAKKNPLTYLFVKDSLNSELKNYQNEVNNLRTQIKTLGATPKLATGTNNVQREGLAYLHQGEAVVPKKYNPAFGGAGQPIVIEMGDVVMDGQKVGRIMTPYITRTVKVGGGNV